MVWEIDADGASCCVMERYKQKSLFSAGPNYTRKPLRSVVNAGVFACSGDTNIRYCISAKGTDLIANMAQVCAENKCEFHCLRDSEPGYFPKDHPIVRALTDIHHEYTGNDTQPYVMGGGTYSRKLPNAIGFGLGGIPRHESLLLRSGHGSSHCPDEALDVVYYFEALTIFTLGLVEADRLLG